MFIDVYWVEGCNYNLLSISQLKKSGYRVEFNKKNAKIFDFDGKLLGSGNQTRGNIFYVDLFDERCLLQNMKIFGFGTKGHVV